MEKGAKIYVAGHTGLVGSGLVRRLQREGFSNLVLPEPHPDLTNAAQTEGLFEREQPEYVLVAAAKVGGIHANDSLRADFIRTNLQIATNVIDTAYRHRVKKLLYLGSSCVYPKHAPQPMKEEHLLTGPLEDTNEAYAIAKIAGLTMCKSYNIQYGTNFIGAMPTNLYGPRDNFDKQNSHVLPALIRKFDDAKQSHAPSVTLWGTGTPRREFLHVDDLAAACVFLMKRFDASRHRFFVNVGVGKDTSIQQLSELVAKVVGYEGRVEWDTNMPDGTPRKLLDVSRLTEMGWQAQIPLDRGIAETYQWYLHNAAKGR